MRVTEIQRITPQTGKALRVLATFDLELSSDVRLFGLRLMRAPDGRLLVYAPSANGGRRTATFSPSMAAAITLAAKQKFEGHDTANGTNSKN
jgi:hypothetical protein